MISYSPNTLFRHVTSARASTTHLLVASLVSIALGVLFYVFFREPSALYLFEKISLPWQSITIPNWAFWLNSIPTLFHALSFSLVTVVVLSKTANSIAFACFFWAFINTIFEAGQLLQAYPAWLTDAASSIATAVFAYFVNGVFDPLDIVFAWSGALVAYCFSRIIYFQQYDKYGAMK